MRKYITVFLIAVGFILASSAANAFDYKEWLPLLPESIGGLDKKGETLVVIETSAFDTEDALISMGNNIPLAEIADSVE